MKNTTCLALVVLLCATACAQRLPESEHRRSRVDAVAAEPLKKIDLNAFCDVRATDAEATEFAYPPGVNVAASRAGQWSWVNVWATWCAPCIKEMPMMLEWKQKLATKTQPVHMQFLSVDESPDDITAFKKTHPWLPQSARTQSSSDLGPWLKSLGLGENVSIPVHIFVDPHNKVRCVRAGGISHHHLETIRALTK